MDCSSRYSPTAVIRLVCELINILQRRPGEVSEAIMGWTDNGKIMPPWITLSEPERDTGREGGQGRERNAGTEKNFLMRL